VLICSRKLFSAIKSMISRFAIFIKKSFPLLDAFLTDRVWHRNCDDRKEDESEVEHSECDDEPGSLRAVMAADRGGGAGCSDQNLSNGPSTAWTSGTSNGYQNRTGDDLVSDYEKIFFSFSFLFFSFLFFSFLFFPF